MLIIDSSYNISLTRGDTGIFVISLVDEEGTEYIPNQGDRIRFAMAKKYGSKEDETLILKEIPINTLTLQIDPEDTKELEFGTYKYDVEYTDIQGHISTILMANFNVTKEVY